MSEEQNKNIKKGFRTPVGVFVSFGIATIVAFTLVFFISNMEWENDLYEAGTIAGIFFVYMTTAVYMVNHYFVRTLKMIYDAADEIGGGNFKYRLNLKTKTAIDAVGRVFNDMAKKLEAIHEREENIVDMKTEFLTIAAHQMRTPLAGIRWLFNALLDSTGAGAGLDDKQKKLIKRGSNLTEDTISLVNDMLNAALIERGEFGYSYSMSSPVDVVDKVVEEENRVGQQKGIDIFFKKPTEEVSNIKMDAEKIQVALQALVDNAIKYSQKNSKVHINMENKENELWISVQDEGIGIPEDEVKKLFTKFFRAKNALQMDTTGNGLGLYIVKNIVDHHQGKIWVESKENEGTKFTIALPKSMDKKVEETGEGEIQEVLSDL